MFKCYVDDYCFYDDRTPLASRKVTSPTLKLSDNSAGNFECTIPTDNEYYNYILANKNKSTFKIECYDKNIFEGRMLTNKTNFQNQLYIYVEGALSYLNDTLQPQQVYNNNTPVQLLNAIITNHNNRVDVTKQFKVGRCNFNKMNEVVQKYMTQYETTLEVIQDFVEAYEMHTRVHREADGLYIDFVVIGENASSQYIEFGKNLSDFSKNFDFEDICTVLLPLGETKESTDPNADYDEYTTIASVNNGSIYLEASAEVMAEYGRLEKKVEWSEVSDPARLKDLAQTYLTKGQYEELTIEVKAVDLQALYGSSYSTLNILDNIRVKSKPNGLDAIYNITEINYKLDRPDQTEYTLGNNTTRTLTRVSNEVNSSLLYKVNSIASQSTILRAARENASNAIKTNTSGYVTLVMDDENDHVQEIVITNTDISDLENWKTDPNVHGWRWNQSGLGYFGNGFNQQVSIAMTGADGGLVANCITTGVMQADRIRGGTLTLGGSAWGATPNGYMRVYNSNDQLTGDFTTEGIHIYQGILESTDGDYWVKIEGGYFFGNYGNQERSVENSAGAIRFGHYVDDNLGMEIMSDDGLFLNVYDMWVGDGSADGTAYTTIDGSITIQTLGYTYYLDFMHGILIGYNDGYSSGTYDASNVTLAVDDLWFNDNDGNQVSIRDFQPGGGGGSGLNGLVRVLTQSQYDALTQTSPSILYAIATASDDDPAVEVIYLEDYEALVEAGEVDSHTLYVLI